MSWGGDRVEEKRPKLINNEASCSGRVNHMAVQEKPRKLGAVEDV